MAAAGAWNLLVVDDEADVHSITQLTFRRRRWRGRRFELASASSAAEARDLLASRSPDHFHVALIDVVMESGRAGLDLCRHIRRTLPRSLRLVVRTGQPDFAPEEEVLNEYDIDFYLAKTEASADRLFTVVRAGLRASQDMATLLALGRQLDGYGRALQRGNALESIVATLGEGLRFLERSHQVRITFASDLDRVAQPGPRGPAFTIVGEDEDAGRLFEAMLLARRGRAAAGRLCGGGAVGLSAREQVLVFPLARDGGPRANGGARAPCAGLVARFVDGEPAGQEVERLESDVLRCLEGWQTADALLRLQ